MMNLIFVFLIVLSAHCINGDDEAKVRRFFIISFF